MDAQSNAGPSVLNAEKRERSRLVEKINPAFPGVRGLRDLWRGWRDYRELWLTVGLYDIRKRYRRSVLGPFWITISLGAFILGLSFIYVPLDAIGLPRIDLGRAEHFDAWMPQSGVAQLLEPGRAWHRVGIERDDPVLATVGRAEIVGRGEAEIGACEMQPEPAVRKAQSLHRAVSRGVVDDYSFEVRLCLNSNRIDATLQQRPRIVIDDVRAPRLQQTPSTSAP